MKSCVLHDDGREQVAGFHMMGDLLGLDAISAETHTCDTVALEDSEVCEIPFPSWSSCRARSRRCSSISTAS